MFWSTAQLLPLCVATSFLRRLMAYHEQWQRSGLEDFCSRVDLMVSEERKIYADTTRDWPAREDRQ